MKNFQYYRPSTVDQAIALLDTRWGPSALLAGGTDLHDLQKEYVAQPARVVSLNAINGLSGIANERAGLKIGANATFAMPAPPRSWLPLRTFCMTSLARVFFICRCFERPSKIGGLRWSPGFS